MNPAIRPGDRVAFRLWNRREIGTVIRGPMPSLCGGEQIYLVQRDGEEHRIAILASEVLCILETVNLANRSDRTSDRQDTAT